MRKKYFSKEAEKCERKDFAPCLKNKEQLADFLQAKSQEIVAFAKEFLGENFPAHFEVPKLLLLPVRKTQTFGKYAYNMVLQEEEKLKIASEAEKPAILEKLSQMQANVKVVRPVRGSFFADGGIVIYYCNVCQLCEESALDFEEYITSVLAHEFFHALHFAACDGTKGWQQVSYWNGVGYEYAKMSTVRESLAEYFRYQWLVQNKQGALLLAMTRELAEPFAVMPSFPYAGVKLLLAKEDLAQEKFAEVFASSLQDWQAAYELLTS